MREVVVMADAHYAAHWDSLADFFAAHPEALNPNQQLRDFVRNCERSDPRPSVINLGDAVDYLDADYIAPASNGADNREKFYREIESLAADFHEIPGNHDHRRGAYNLRAWGLDQLNIDRATLTRHIGEIGHTKLRSPRQELRAVFSLTPPLGGFRGARRPTYRRIGGIDSILVNTHGDGFFSPRALLRTVAGVVADRWRGRSPRIGIKVAGPTPDDLAGIAMALGHCRRDPVLLCMHAPLLHPVPGASRQSVSLDPDRLVPSLQRHSLDHNTIAQGGGALLHLLRNAVRNDGRNIVVLAGHAHDAHYFLIDAGTLLAREVGCDEFNASWHDSRYIKHATVLPLGVIEPHAPLPRTGYARIGEGGLTEVVTRSFPRGVAQEQPPCEQGAAA